MAPRGRATQQTRDPRKMITKLEWTQSNVQQNIEQFQTPTMGVPINNKSTTTPLNGQQPF